ncbi:MAG: hypothetical protein VX834_08360, partial [Myxococcota bacterium]|nr:hypothetical protein [Myxococcota bacterium]
MTHMSGSHMAPWTIGILLLVCLSIQQVSCTHHIVVPNPPTAVPERVQISHPVTWNIKRFDIHGASRHDDAERATYLQQALIDYLGSTTELGPYVPQGNDVPPAIELAIDVSVTKETKRTVILDLANIVFYPMLWGSVT